VRVIEMRVRESVRGWEKVGDNVRKRVEDNTRESKREEKWVGESKRELQKRVYETIELSRREEKRVTEIRRE